MRAAASGSATSPKVRRYAIRLSESPPKLRTPAPNREYTRVSRPSSASPTRRWTASPRRAYYRRNCWLGASFLDESAAAARHAIGVDKLLWGSDYPHIEGTWPHTKERLRQVFAAVPREEVARMLGGNAAVVYGFDAPALGAVAALHGPPLDAIGA